jgi:alkanesulfonate monooxygenase SsuD/methylene tetrahydromethanopterin reductase-like flavin-dependent oxidoreductase (luciferase family)
MKFIYFHLMPWTDIAETGQDWPVANKWFDPAKATQLYRSYIDSMAQAEDCGFEWIGCNEHHFSPYGLMSNCNIIGSALVDRTKTARIAMLGNLVPLLNPIRVAEEYAMLDVMSGGRLIDGFMRGIPHEYVAYNGAPSESFERLDEAYQLIVKAWTEPEPFGWEGKYYQYRAVSIWPRPFQKPHPPILMSASTPESARFAAAHRAIMGIVLLPDLDTARACIRAYRETARADGWEPGPEHILVGMHMCIADTDDEAKRHMAEGLRYFYEVLGGGPRTAARLVVQTSRFYRDAQSSEQLARRRARLRQTTVDEAAEGCTILCGSPKTVIKQIEHIKDELGNGILNITMKVGNIPEPVIQRGMALFRDRVFPAVKDL